MAVPSQLVRERTQINMLGFLECYNKARTF